MYIASLIDQPLPWPHPSKVRMVRSMSVARVHHPILREVLDIRAWEVHRPFHGLHLPWAETSISHCCEIHNPGNRDELLTGRICLNDRPRLPHRLRERRSLSAIHEYRNLHVGSDATKGTIPIVLRHPAHSICVGPCPLLWCNQYARHGDEWRPHSQPGVRIFGDDVPSVEWNADLRELS